MAEVLLVTAGWVHPPYLGRVWLRKALAQLPGYSFAHASSLESATQLGLSRYAAMVLYFHHPGKILAGPALDTFREYVARGGGVLALHSATASYKATAPYFDILGGRFTGHGPVHGLEIRPAIASDPIFSDVPPFTITDELYLHDLAPDLRVHFLADHQGKPVPVVWTREYGKGRVCYSCPGHRAASMRHPAVQGILRAGLQWVVGS